MGTYSKLLLSTGGGIISQIQQAEQVENTATILIGLGGTGIDCLTEVKNAVRERLQPDNPEAVVPAYDHIRFLAVDTDLKSGISGFEKNETFDISNPNVKQALRSEIAIKSRRELDWLDPDKIDGADIGDAGAGGFRQAGRYMLMDKSNQFLTRMKELITLAKKDAGKASLYIHIFAGVSGGTGSGTFLDACYLVRKAVAEANGGDGVILGYFFLPDVNLSNIPITASLVHTYVPKNGYAALQELDYCMRLPENGGFFTQTYKNGVQIDWNEPPVDLCHLISATDRSYQVVKNAYNNAMKVTAEYVMDFLTKPQEKTHADANEVGIAEAEAIEAESKFSIKSHLANFSQMVSAADGLKTHGYHLRYLVIGASCASIPMRKINTYLTSKLFQQFADLKNHVPAEAEVQAIADKTKISNIDALLVEITKNGGGSDLAIVPDAYGMEFTRDNGDKELLYHYTNQKAEKTGVIEKNARSMTDEKNADSLIGRICTELNACAVDLTRGPAYAYGVVQASVTGNLINIIDGMIKNVEKRRSQTAYNVYEQAGSYKEYYEQSRQVWYAEKNRMRRKAQKAFDQYVIDMETYIRGEIEVEQLEQLLKVLRTLKEQVSRKADSYYLKFSRVMTNLTETFKENYTSLINDVDENEAGVFSIPLVRISEIRPKLDETVEKMDKAGVLNQFVTYMFTTGKDGKTCWEDEDESKIAKAVKYFFINNVFSDFANKSITRFLFEKYNTDNPQEVTDRIYNQYMTKLKDKSEALFPVDSMIYGGSDNAIAYISVPSTANVIIDAAQQLNAQYPEFAVKKSALKDRIYIMRCSCALPIGSYANGEQYEQSYYGDKQEGRHYYIGQGGSALFNNWHDLLPLRPQSLIDDKNLPERLLKILEKARKAYDDAVNGNILNGNHIMKVSDASMNALENAYTYAMEAEARIQFNPASASIVYRDAAAKMKAVLGGIIYEKTGYRLPTGNVSTSEIEERIRRDYFVSSPALHTVVRNELARLEKYKAKYTELERSANAEGEKTQELKDFASALFTGVISWDKRFALSYNKMEYGIPSPEMLCDLAQPDRFKYAKLPLYQAYLSYQKIDDNSKRAILAEASQKNAALAENVVASIKACEAAISMQFLQGQNSMAGTYPEVTEEVKKIMGTIKQELNAAVDQLKAFGLY